MEYREIDVHAPGFVANVRVFLDGRDVTNESYWARVPAEPGVEGDGEVKGYDQPMRKTPDGKGLMTWHKTGRVYWVQKAA